MGAHKVKRQRSDTRPKTHEVRRGRNPAVASRDRTRRLGPRRFREAVRADACVRAGACANGTQALAHGGAQYAVLPGVISGRPPPPSCQTARPAGAICSSSTFATARARCASHRWGLGEGCLVLDLRRGFTPPQAGSEFAPEPGSSCKSALIKTLADVGSQGGLLGTLGHPQGVSAAAIIGRPAWLSMRQYLDFESIFAKALG